MIISHKYRFIFIKTKKTAGTSVEIALSRFCGEEDIITPIRPETPQQLQELGFKGAQNYKLPFKQFIIKDWSRLLRGNKEYGLHSHVSARRLKAILRDDNLWNSYFKFSIERNPFDRLISRYYWKLRHARHCPSLEDYLLTLKPTYLSNWSLYTIEDKVAVDYMLRYESLEEGLHDIERALGLPSPLRLPQAKSGIRKSRQHYSALITPKARARIEALCAKEMAAFSYQWEESDT